LEAATASAKEDVEVAMRQFTDERDYTITMVTGTNAIRERTLLGTTTPIHNMQ
jgi:hypothetical protein